MSFGRSQYSLLSGPSVTASLVLCLSLACDTSSNSTTGGVQPSGAGRPEAIVAAGSKKASSEQAPMAEAKRLTEALDSDPNNLDILVRLGHLLLTTGAIPEAHALTDRALRLAPKNPEARVHRAVLDSAAGNSPSAAKLLDAVIADHPDLAEAWLSRGMVAVAQGEQDVARQSFERFVALSPDSPEAEKAQLYLRGALEVGAQRRQGRDIDQAQQAAYAAALKPLRQRVIDAPTDLRALLQLGHGLLETPHLREAKAITVRALKLDPSNAEALSHAAAISAAAGDPKGALAGLSQILKDHPEFAEAWFLRGQIALQIKNGALARECWEKFIALSPEGPARQRAQRLVGQAEHLH